MRKRQEAELKAAEVKTQRFSLGVTRVERIRNEYMLDILQRKSERPD